MIEPDYVATIEYTAYGKRRNLLPSFQCILNQFIDFVRLLNWRTGCEWYNSNYYTNNAYRDFQIKRALNPSLAEKQNWTTDNVSLASPPWIQDYTILTTPVTPPPSKDLASLLPSFDSKFACILHTTLNVSQEACNPICAALSAAHLATWDTFVPSLMNPGDVADLKYLDQGIWHPLSLNNQRDLNTFVDLAFFINSQADREWYDLRQYLRAAFLHLCNIRARSPGLAALHNISSASVPLAPFPQVTDNVTLASISVLPVPITSSTPTVHQSTPTSACKTDAHSTVDNPKTPTRLPGSSNSGTPTDSTSTGSPSYTWKYSPSTDSVRFTKVDSPSTPGIVHTGITPGDNSSQPRHAPHFTCTGKPPPANS
eukprot:jgi/Psemu1/64188/estExt_Genemark1.C_550089